MHFPSNPFQNENEVKLRKPKFHKFSHFTNIFRPSHLKAADNRADMGITAKK
jgi:hypothetical protein